MPHPLRLLVASTILCALAAPVARADPASGAARMPWHDYSDEEVVELYRKAWVVASASIAGASSSKSKRFPASPTTTICST